MTTLTYLELNRKIAIAQHELRDYRLKLILKTLAGLRTKSRQLHSLELKLTKELNKKLQNSIEVDSLIENFEAIL